MSVIGVEFGTCSLRAVQLHRRGGAWRVHHWVNIESAITSEEPNAPHAPADVAIAFGPGTFAGRRAALALSPPEVEYRLLEVPAAVLDQPPEQMRTALQVELERQLPWPVAESELAAWSTRPGAVGKAPAMVVAAKRAALEARLATLAGARLHCRRADVVPNAVIQLRRAARRATEATDNMLLWGVLDCGFSSARLYLVHGDRPVYARMLRTGGRELTRQLAKALHIEFADAEKYKRIYGIQASDRGVRTVIGGFSRIAPADLPAVLYAILRPTIETLANEIERSYRFVIEQRPDLQAGPLCLIGGGARLHGLADLLGGRLGVPVRSPDPAEVFGAAGRAAGGAEHPAIKPDVFCTLASCIGLALGEEAA